MFQIGRQSAVGSGLHGLQSLLLRQTGVSSSTELMKRQWLLLHKKKTIMASLSISWRWSVVDESTWWVFRAAVRGGRTRISSPCAGGEISSPGCGAGRGGQSAGAGRSSWNYLSRYLYSHSCSRLRGVGLRQSRSVSWALGWTSCDFLAGAVRDVGGRVRVDSAYRWGGKVTSRLHNTHVCFNLFCHHEDPNLSRPRWEPMLWLWKVTSSAVAWPHVTDKHELILCGCVLWGDWGWEGHNATLSILSAGERSLLVFFFNGQNQKNFIQVTRFAGYPWVSSQVYMWSIS